MNCSNVKPQPPVAPAALSSLLALLPPPERLTSEPCCSHAPTRLGEAAQHSRSQTKRSQGASQPEWNEVKSNTRENRLRILDSPFQAQPPLEVWVPPHSSQLTAPCWIQVIHKVSANLSQPKARVASALRGAQGSTPGSHASTSTASCTAQNPSSLPTSTERI